MRVLDFTRVTGNVSRERREDKILKVYPDDCVAKRTLRKNRGHQTRWDSCNHIHGSKLSLPV